MDSVGDLLHGPDVDAHDSRSDVVQLAGDNWHQLHAEPRGPNHQMSFFSLEQSEKTPMWSPTASNKDESEGLALSVMGLS